MVTSVPGGPEVGEIEKTSGGAPRARIGMVRSKPTTITTAETISLQLLVVFKVFMAAPPLLGEE
jgi:hypothetical protein